MNPLTLTLAVICLTSCNEKQVTDAHIDAPNTASKNELIGTWKSEIYDSEWGQLYSVDSYFSDGRFEALYHSPDTSDEIDFSGTYIIDNNVIRRMSQGEKQEIIYRIDGDSLNIEAMGKKVAFKRIKSKKTITSQLKEDKQVKNSEVNDSSIISNENGLIGTWKSEDGEGHSVQTYFPDGRFEGSDYLQDTAESFEWAGTYALKDNMILRTYEGVTQEIPYRIDGDYLHVEFMGEKATMKRIKNKK